MNVGVARITRIAKPFHDVRDGILGHAQILGGPATGAIFTNGLNDFRRKLVGSRALSRLAVWLFTLRTGSDQAGSDALAQKGVLELGDPCQHCRLQR